MCCLTVGTQSVILKNFNCPSVSEAVQEGVKSLVWEDGVTVCTVTWLQCWAKGFKCHLVFGPYNLRLFDAVILIIVLPL